MTLLFLTIIFVPLLFFAAAFLGIGYHENVNVIHELTKEDVMIGAMISKRFMGYLVLAMVVILILTSALITAWVNQDIYKPIKELSIAMRKIAEGDFDYRLPDKQEGEIGHLHDNYEQMRLQLKENAEEKMQNEKKAQADSKMENDLLEQAVKNMTVEIPTVMFENKAQDMVEEFGYRLQTQGMNMDMYMKYTGTTPEALTAQFMPQAEAQVRTTLLLEKIAEVENIEITEEDINGEYDRMVKDYGMELDKVKSIVPVEEIKRQLTIQKAAKVITDSAVVTQL